MNHAGSVDDENLNDVWNTCAGVIKNLRWHKLWFIVVGPTIEPLLDDPLSKPQCLLQLSQLFYSVGRYAESKQLPIHTLKLW